MADGKLVSQLDKKLMEDGIINALYKSDYKKVHHLLNTHFKKSGSILTEESFKKGEEKLREWLIVLHKKGATQEKLSSYLRCGLAHLSFDFIESTYKTISKDDLITRSLQSLKLRGFHKTFFKAAPAQIKKQSIKKKPVKKTIKAVKKKTVKKKTVKKTVKKSVAKKKKPLKSKSSAKSRKKKGFLSKLFG